MADAKRTLRECLDERLKEGRARGLERRPPLLDMAGEGPVGHLGGRGSVTCRDNVWMGVAAAPLAGFCKTYGIKLVIPFSISGDDVRNGALRSGSVSRRSRRRLRRHVWPADGAGSPKKRSRRLRRISGLTNACSCRAAIRATSLALWR